MAESSVEGFVPLSPTEAYDVFVNQIDVWWPRQGIFPYSFAPKTTRPLHIRFEPYEKGRLYETFLDNTEYVIGQIVQYQPPHKMVHTWRDPSWDGHTTITVTFREMDGGTQFIMEQDGFAAVGQPDMPPYYDIGNRQTMAAFVAHCVATYELRQLQHGSSGD